MNLLFKALRDPTRRRILEMLKERDLTVGEVSAAFEMSLPSISYHLDLLKHAQLVSARKNGQFVTYSLDTTVLEDSLGWLLQLIAKPKTKRHEKQTRVDRSGAPRRAVRSRARALG
ncbi:MAG: autorepressor SdpR family transcription factor [Chthoniobacterales bacterium]